MKCFCRLIPLLLISAVVFSSCFGFNAKIRINKNGEARLDLEYRINENLDSLGKLDGNEKWETIPSGKADIERSLSRMPGAELKSFSSKKDKNNVVNKIRLNFNSIEALASFMDAAGQGAAYSAENGSRRLLFTLAGGENKTDPQLQSLLDQVFAPYTGEFSVDFPNTAELRVLDKRGIPLTLSGGVKIREKGRTVSFSIPMAELLAVQEGLVLEFSW
jgi:hypothetical protein